jgi:hypothetical protein
MVPFNELSLQFSHGAQMISPGISFRQKAIPYTDLMPVKFSSMRTRNPPWLSTISKTRRHISPTKGSFKTAEMM